MICSRGAVRVAAYVEGAVEGDGEPLGGLHHAAARLDVDVALGRKGAYHHAVYALAAAKLDVAHHDIYLLAGVEERTLARTYQYVHIYRKALVAGYGGYRSRRGCYASCGECRAELYAYGASGLRLVRLGKEVQHTSIFLIFRVVGFYDKGRKFFMMRPHCIALAAAEECVLSPFHFK